jgi:hypothetical protein
MKAYSRDLKRVLWPLNLKASGIEKYDGSTNLTEWLEVYQLAIEATGEDSYIMVNYLPVFLSSSARTWLLGLPWAPFGVGTTYVGCSPATFRPHAHSW